MRDRTISFKVPAYLECSIAGVETQLLYRAVSQTTLELVLSGDSLSVSMSTRIGSS